MFEATCSDCGNACQVPFKPTGRRPVLCTTCFRKDGGSERPSFGEKRAPREPRFGGSSNDQSRDIQQLKEQLRTVNEKLDTILELLDGETE
jgi:CxxC-x17-CxxC domain-containing protein